MVIGDSAYWLVGGVIGIATGCLINETIVLDMPSISFQESIEDEPDGEIAEEYDAYDYYGFDEEAPTRERVGRQNGDRS